MKVFRAPDEASLEERAWQNGHMCAERGVIKTIVIHTFENSFKRFADKQHVIILYENYCRCGCAFLATLEGEHALNIHPKSIKDNLQNKVAFQPHFLPMFL